MRDKASANSDSSLRPASGPPARSLAPDLARGFMLAFIALANVSWFLWGQPGSGSSAHPPPDNPVDVVLQFAMLVAVDGRSYPLFAFLFGYGMVQFYRSRLDRGMEPRDVRRMLRRRHWAMLVLGALHAALLFMGDILAAYGIAGLLLVWIFFGRRERTLWIWVSVIGGLLALMAVFSLVGGLSLAGAPPEVLAEVEQNSPFSSSETRDLAHGQADYLASVLGRLSAWAFLTIFQLAALVIPLAILLGWLAARHRVLDEPWRHGRFLRAVAFGGIAIGWLGAMPTALTHLDTVALPDPLYWTFMGINSLTGLAGGLGYAAMFGLIAAHFERRAAGSPPRWVRGVAAVGQRSLTFYLFQSIVFAPVLSAWGLGLGQQLSTWGVLLIALAVWAVSIPLAYALAERGQRGPAEVMLRQLTYGKGR